VEKLDHVQWGILMSFLAKVLRIIC